MAIAQVGVNTPNPKGMFHLDGKKNNETSGTSAAPVPGIKITDGAQNENYVLTSDANGNGLWKPVRLTVERGVNGPGIDLSFTGTTYRLLYRFTTG